MISQDIMAVINQLELTTRRLISGPLSGDYRYKLKGTGFEFDQLRDYQQGDDVRFIDWKSSARSQKMLVRSYLADKNRTILLAIDISQSINYGSGNVLKFEIIQKLAAILAFASLHAKDSVGMLLFTDQVELFVQPKASSEHIITIVKKIITHKTHNNKTDINSALTYIAGLKQKNMLVCLLSDFMSYIDNSALKALMYKHDLIAFRCCDERELTFPAAGLLSFKDKETGVCSRLQTHEITSNLQQWHKLQENKLKSAGVDCFTVTAGQEFAQDLVLFLRKRARRS